MVPPRQSLFWRHYDKHGGNEMLKRMLIVGATACLFSTGAWATSSSLPAICSTVPNYGALQTALTSAVSAAHGIAQANNIGFSLNMWATVVAADGTVCAVVSSGSGPIQGQWLASRLISAQKATAANSLSLGSGNGPAPLNGEAFAISTANLYSATLPDGSLFGLQTSNPENNYAAYGNSPGNQASTREYGKSDDPMVGLVVGGINVFGGGLALYDTNYNRVGAIGVSGDTSCMDHIVAWYLRNALNYDNLKNVQGFASAFAGDTTHPDNIIFDIQPGPTGVGVSVSGYGHPVCKGAAGNPGLLNNKQAEAIVQALPSATKH